jgi:hypothetical protein
MIQLEMSKCGINRFKSGGRCGASSSCVRGGGLSDSQLGANFASMMAAREAQDVALRSAPPVKQYATPALTQVANEQTLAIHQQAPSSKQKDIDCILQGDWGN